MPKTPGKTSTKRKPAKGKRRVSLPPSPKDAMERELATLPPPPGVQADVHRKTPMKRKPTRKRRSGSASRAPLLKFRPVAIELEDEGPTIDPLVCEADHRRALQTAYKWFSKWETPRIARVIAIIGRETGRAVDDDGEIASDCEDEIELPPLPPPVWPDDVASPE